MSVTYWYPFSALVGHEETKRALLIVLTNYKAGPLIIGGPQGTGKSVLARSSMALLREQKFFNLPVHITEDMLFGAIDMEKTLKSGEKRVMPGLLDRAHKQVLYMDDVHLLRPNLLVAILDANEQGFHILEREGLSHCHDVAMHSIGSMNTSEDPFPRYIWERIGMYVQMKSLETKEERMEIMKRRLCFEKDPEAFYNLYEEEETALKERLKKAQDLLPHVLINDAMMALAAQMACQASCVGHRTELYLLEVAKGIAALENRTYILPKDMEEAAMYVLPHRMRQEPTRASQEEDSSQEGDSQYEEPETEKDASKDDENHEWDGSSEESHDSAYDDESHGNNDGSHSEDSLDGHQEKTDLQEDRPASHENQTHLSQHKDSDDENTSSEGSQDRIDPIMQGFHFPKMLLLDQDQRRIRHGSGKRSVTRTDTKQGRYVRAEMGKGPVTDLAFDATIRAAAPFQKSRDKGNCAIAIRPEDMRQKVREKRIGNTFLFAVDASGSMGARERMSAVKGAIFSMLQEAYENRDRVGMIVFRRETAEVLLPITRSVDLAKKCLGQLPTGGKTPLAEGLAKALFILQSQNKKGLQMEPVLIVVTDGRANAVQGENDPVEKAKDIGTLIKKMGIRSVMIDTEADFIKLGVAKEVAQAMGASYYSLQKLTKEELIKIVKNV